MYSSSVRSPRRISATACIPDVNGSACAIKGDALRRKFDAGAISTRRRGHQVLLGAVPPHGGIFAGVGAETHDGALEQAILLEWIRCELDLRPLSDANEARVDMAHQHIRLQVLSDGHQRQKNRAWRHDRTDRMGREVLDHAGLRRAQLHRLGAMQLLGEFLLVRPRCAGGLRAFGMQLLSIGRPDLREPPLRLR